MADGKGAQWPTLKSNIVRNAIAVTKVKKKRKLQVTSSNKQLINSLHANQPKGLQMVSKETQSAFAHHSSVPASPRTSQLKHLAKQKWNSQRSVDNDRNPCLQSICTTSLSHGTFDSHWGQPALGLSGYDWTKKCASTTGSVLSMLESCVSWQAICNEFNLHQQKRAWKCGKDVRLQSHNPSQSDQQFMSHSFSPNIVIQENQLPFPNFHAGIKLKSNKDGHFRI